MNSPAQSRSRAEDSLALSCLAHFEQEEALLAASLEALRQIRECLIHRDLVGLNQAIARQQQLAQTGADLAALRQQLRQRISTHLGVPAPQATVRALAERLGEPLRERLLNVRQRLVQMAADVERLNRGNLALMRQSIELLQRLLESLCERGSGTPRYTADGAMTNGSYGSFLETRC